MQQTQTLHDIGYVSQRLGVARRTVTKWLKAPTAKFPLPSAYLVRNPDRPAEPLWSAEQIPLLRAWLAGRLHLNNPDSYWRSIDAGEAPEVHDGQTGLDLPL